MGRALYDARPEFRETLDRCDEILRPRLERPLLSVLYPAPGTTSLVDETGYTQPALFALEYALATLWRAWGIEPECMLGHSVGEYVAACLAGVFSLEDGLTLVAERGRLMQALPRDGAMAAVFTDEDRVREAIASGGDEVDIAAVNTPDSVVISGRRSAVERFTESLRRRGVGTRPLTVSHAFHSSLMDPVLGAFRRAAAGVTYGSPRLKFLSNLTGEPAGEEVATPSYWQRHLRETVRFSDGMRTLARLGCDVYLEVGPKPTLVGLGRRCLPGDHAWLTSLREGRHDWEQMLETVGALYARGAPIDWTRFDRGRPLRRVSLPTYPFERDRHWPERRTTGLLAEAWTGHDAATHPLLGHRIDLAATVGTHVWQGEVSGRRLPFLLDHRVQGQAVLPAAAYSEMALAAHAELCGEGPVRLREMRFHKPLFVSERDVHTIQTVVDREDSDRAAIRVYSRPATGDGEPLPWVLHMTGFIDRIMEDTPRPQSVPEVLDAIRSRCAATVHRQRVLSPAPGAGERLGTDLPGCLAPLARRWRGAERGRGARRHRFGDRALPSPPGSRGCGGARPHCDDSARGLGWGPRRRLRGRSH